MYFYRDAYCLKLNMFSQWHCNIACFSPARDIRAKFIYSTGYTGTIVYSNSEKVNLELKFSTSMKLARNELL